LLEQLQHGGLRTAADIAFRYFDYGATLLWALSGARLGARRGFDLTGTFAIALVSACGGGLLRDALFLQAGPPLVARSPVYLLLVLAATLLAWGLGERRHAVFEKQLRVASRLADAVGLGAFAVVGLRLALAVNIPLPGALLTSVVNAVGGGMLRSLLLRRTPQVFQPGQLTAIAALAGALLYSGLHLALEIDARTAGGVAMLLAALLNWTSVQFGYHTVSTWHGVGKRKPSRKEAWEQLELL
jgi:uncharacterized membrane protein YeiH